MLVSLGSEGLHADDVAVLVDGEERGNGMHSVCTHTVYLAINLYS